MMNLGKTLYGFCNGFFGRDDYDTKVIISEGSNWIVCKYSYGDNRVTFASFKNYEEKQEYINSWTNKHDFN